MGNKIIFFICIKLLVYQSLCRFSYLMDVRKKAMDLYNKNVHMEQARAIVMIQAV